MLSCWAEWLQTRLYSASLGNGNSINVISHSKAEITEAFHNLSREHEIKRWNHSNNSSVQHPQSIYEVQSLVSRAITCWEYRLAFIIRTVWAWSLGNQSPHPVIMNHSDLPSSFTWEDLGKDTWNCLMSKWKIKMITVQPVYLLTLWHRVNKKLMRTHDSNLPITKKAWVGQASAGSSANKNHLFFCKSFVYRWGLQQHGRKVIFSKWIWSVCGHAMHFWVNTH